MGQEIKVTGDEISRSAKPSVIGKVAPLETHSESTKDSKVTLVISSYLLPSTFRNLFIEDNR